MLNLSFTGCLTPEDNRTVREEPSIFDFDRAIPETTWYHFSGGVNAQGGGRSEIWHTGYQMMSDTSKVARLLYVDA
mgnify:CR=1 FL=1